MRGSTKTGMFLLAAILAVLSSIPFQAEDPPWADRQHRPKALPTKIHGEAGIIVKRHMWFYSPRKEGSEGGMALKTRAGRRIHPAGYEVATRRKR